MARVVPVGLAVVPATLVAVAETSYIGRLGTEFGIPMQGSWQKKPPAPGTVVTFKFMELTNNQVPRHPTWLGVRSDYSGPAMPPVDLILSQPGR